MLKIFPKFLIYGLLILSMKPAYGQISVPYINNDPVIDGLPDINLQSFKLNEFATARKSNPENPGIKAGYYIAYSESFLYLYIEASAEKIIFRDRGYQNGDGFHLMIGKPLPDGEPASEFYILGFSPDENNYNKLVWYYNIDLSGRRLDSKTKYKSAEKNGKITFELLLPWSVIYPYNPLLSEKIGFNLCFVKAIGEGEKTLYFVKEDNKFQNEQSKREYEILDFKAPATGTSSIVSRPIKNTISHGENLRVKLSGYNKEVINKIITVRIFSGENSLVATKNTTVEFEPGISEREIIVDCENLISGGYILRVFADNLLIDEHYISIIHDYNFNEWRAKLNSLSDKLSAGNLNTLKFYINNTEHLLRSAKDYECSYFIRKNISEVDELIKALEKGDDRISNKRGYYRRAYQPYNSDELCPYSVYVPFDYSPKKRYPLLVYLHGSGEDDRALERTDILPEEFIVVAPGGAGTSNCFATKEAQNDIEESISDVIKNFNIDTAKIILSGFSMGGYGVYRTFYENPSRYCAIAILSGHPDLARRWINREEINFLDKKNLTKFGSVPIYVFHGKGDLNCPFELTVRVVENLKSIGANITFIADDSGHGVLSIESRNRYYSWLREQLQSLH